MCFGLGAIATGRVVRGVILGGDGFVVMASHPSGGLDQTGLSHTCSGGIPQTTDSASYLKGSILHLYGIDTAICIPNQTYLTVTSARQY